MNRGDFNNRYQLKNKTDHNTNNTRLQCETKRICDSHNVLPSLIADCPHCRQILSKLNGQGDEKSFIQDKLKPFIHNYAKIFCNKKFPGVTLEQNVQHSKVKEQEYHSRTHQNKSRLKRSKIKGNGNKDELETVRDDHLIFGNCEPSCSNDGMYRNNKYEAEHAGDNEHCVNYCSKQKDRFVLEIPELATISSGTENETETLSNTLSDLNCDFGEGTTKENAEEVKHNCEQIKANEKETKVEDKDFKILEQSEISKKDKQTEKLEIWEQVNMQTPRSTLNLRHNQNMNPETVHETVDCSGNIKESPPNLKGLTESQQITKTLMHDMQHYQQLFEFARSACQKHETSFKYDKYSKPNYQPQKEPMFNAKNLYSPQTPYPGYGSEIKNVNYLQSGDTCRTNPHRCLANPAEVNCYNKDIYLQSKDCYKESYQPPSWDNRSILDSNRLKGSQRKAILDSITKTLPACWDYNYTDKQFRERVTAGSVGQNNVYQDNVFGKKKTFDSTVASINYNVSTQDKQYFNAFKTSLYFTPNPSNINGTLRADKSLGKNETKNETYIRSVRSEPSSLKLKCFKFKPVVKPYNLNFRRSSKFLQFSKSINPLNKHKTPDISKILKKYLGSDYKRYQSLLQSNRNDDRGLSLIEPRPLIGRGRKFLSIKNIRSLVNSKSRSYSKQDRKKSNMNFDRSKRSSPKKIYVIQKSNCKHGNDHYDAVENIFQVDKNKKKLKDKDFNGKCHRIRELIADQKNHNQLVPNNNKISLNILDMYRLRNKALSKEKGPKSDFKNNVKLLERAKSEKGNEYKMKLISFSKNRKLLEKVETKDARDAFTKIMSSKSKYPRGIRNKSKFYKKKDSCEPMKMCIKEIDTVKKDWKKYEVNDDNKLELFKVERVPKPLEPLVSKIIHPGNFCYTTKSSGK